MGSYRGMSMMAAMCAASMAAIPVAADTARQHPSSRGGDRFIPVDRSHHSRRTNGGNSGTLSKLLAAGRRRGRV